MSVEILVIVSGIVLLAMILAVIVRKPKSDFYSDTAPARNGCNNHAYRTRQDNKHG